MKDLQVRFKGLKNVMSCQIGLRANWCLKGSFLSGCQERFPLASTVRYRCVLSTINNFKVVKPKCDTLRH